MGRIHTRKDKPTDAHERFNFGRIHNGIVQGRANFTKFIQEVAEYNGDKWHDLMQMGWVELLAYLTTFADRYVRDRERERLRRLQNG